MRAHLLNSSCELVAASSARSWRISAFLLLFCLPVGENGAYTCGDTNELDGWEMTRGAGTHEVGEGVGSDPRDDLDDKRRKEQPQHQLHRESAVAGSVVSGRGSVLGPLARPSHSTLARTGGSVLVPTRCSRLSRSRSTQTRPPRRRSSARTSMSDSPARIAATRRSSWRSSARATWCVATVVRLFPAQSREM